QQVTATLTTPDHTHLFHPTTGNRITTN
ncbi:hypothetical protein FHR81_005632, partial [Actinoalloteichus hoggarensis]|nr:hypothetical protein [Actinoalloteichus hoggarensis]MBB5924547.1 hypothetical protein [Actinoalloteichus hoggarensis]